MIKRLLILSGLLALPLAAHALDFRNATENVIVYDAGSTKATPLFILRQGTPVEVIVSINRWIKVRESSGGLGWVETTQLGEARQLIVTAPTASVRNAPSDTAPEVFLVEKDVLLEIEEKPTGAWVRVRHRDGQSGFIALKSIWGI